MYCCTCESQNEVRGGSILQPGPPFQVALYATKNGKPVSYQFRLDQEGRQWSPTQSPGTPTNSLPRNDKHGYYEVQPVLGAQSISTGGGNSWSPAGATSQNFPILAPCKVQLNKVVCPAKTTIGRVLDLANPAGSYCHQAKTLPGHCVVKVSPEDGQYKKGTFIVDFTENFQGGSCAGYCHPIPPL